MEENKSLARKTLGAVALPIQLVLCFAGWLCCLYPIVFNGVTGELSAVMAAGIYTLVLLYALYGYRVPHGNMLRYALFVCAVLLGVFYTRLPGAETLQASVLLCVALVAYMAGRLNRRKESCCIIAVVAMILLADGLYLLGTVQTTDTLQKLLPFHPLVAWCGFAVSYLSRYQLHREAGRKEENS